MNSIKLLGRTTDQIELKKTNSGKFVATFSFAVKRPFSKNTTDFLNIIAWDKTAELLSKHVTKGQMLVIEGYLTTRKYETQDGQKRAATEIVVEKFHFVGNKGENGQATANEAPSYGIPDGLEELADEDSLPFD